jgi:hypothetical protein
LDGKVLLVLDKLILEGCDVFVENAESSSEALETRFGILKSRERIYLEIFAMKIEHLLD